MLALCEDDPTLGEPLVPGLPYLRAEAVWAARQEMAHTLTDVLARRTRALILDREAAALAAPGVAILLASELGWDQAEQDRQVADFECVVQAERQSASARPASAAGAARGLPRRRESAVPAGHPDRDRRRVGGPPFAVRPGDRCRPAFLSTDSAACAPASTPADRAASMPGGTGGRSRLVWALDETPPALPAAVARPTTASEVAAVLKLCAESDVPVTAAAGRSGVCGASVPAFGGVSLDLTGLDGIVGVDDASLLVDVRAGTFGDTFEETLQSTHGLTLGHWPQSIVLSTVGGWLACRGAGQYSTRYGKIEDMVVGLEVALADGRVIRTGGTGPRSATGPDLTQLFRRQRRDARDHHRGSPARPSSAAGGAPRRLLVSRTSKRGWTPAGASCVGAPRRRSSGSTTRPSRGDRSMSNTALPSSCSTRATRP